MFKYTKTHKDNNTTCKQERKTTQLVNAQQTLVIGAVAATAATSWVSGGAGTVGVGSAAPDSDAKVNPSG
jgi:hypothetical protein